MPDVEWSQEQLPPPKPGMSTGAKVAIGCALLVIVAGGSCVAMVVGGVTKATHFVQTAGDIEWATMKKVTDQLLTPAGAQAAWDENPGLAQSFTSQDEFLQQATLMRPLLEPLPAERPSLFGGRLRGSMSEIGNQKHVVLRYDTLGGATLTFTFDNDHVTNLRLEKTVVSTVVTLPGPDAGAVPARPTP